ncbi:MAG: V-type ATP synthase subunit C [Clostridiales bacterium]|jgi:V/A-type H+-transporting ATPase subunit C|nr:V-type ATP synthase subunit C [Clostridiales bacterium]
MNQSDYADYAGYIRVLEKKLLPGESINKIADAPSLQESIRIASQNGGYDFSSLKYPEDFESVLINELKRIYKTGFEICVNKDIVKALSIKHDYNNLKMAIKSHLLNSGQPSYSYATDVNPDDFSKLFADKEDLSQIPPYIKEAFKKAMDVYEKTKDPQSVSIALDKEMFTQMVDLAEKLNSELITDYVRASVDSYNLKALIRCMSLKKDLSFLNTVLIEGGKISKKEISDYFNKPNDYISNKLFYKYMGQPLKAGVDNFQVTKSLSLFEKLLDDYLVTLLKKVKYIPFGPELIFAYIANKENEIRQLRIIFTGKRSGIPAEKLKERLRENYA